MSTIPICSIIVMKSSFQRIVSFCPSNHHIGSQFIDELSQIPLQHAGNHLVQNNTSGITTHAETMTNIGADRFISIVIKNVF
jgi:hypothetical protein